MKQKSTIMGLVAILYLTIVLTPTLIDDASALKSSGNPLLKYGSATDNIVCGGILCSEVNTITVKEKTTMEKYSWVWVDGHVQMREFVNSIQ